MARNAASSPTTTFVLEGDLDLFSLHAQWERLQPLLGGDGRTVHLDLSGMGDLDLSGVQLLCALDRDLSAKGGRLILAGAREEWVPRFSSLGLASLFERKTP